MGGVRKMAIYADIQYCIYGANYLFTTSAKILGGWGLFFAEVQYSIYADIVGGFEKVRKYADVI